MEWLFFQTSPLLVGLLSVVVLLFAAEAGFRIGRRHREHAVRRRGQTTTAQAAILGLLGLLLAFSFSISQSRFDMRRRLVVEEANSIGTTYLRAQLLPEPQRRRTLDLLREYAGSRVPGLDPEAVKRAIARSEQLHRELWGQARAAAQAEASPAVTLLFTESLNQTIDLHTTRVTAHLYRAPAGLLLLLHVAAALAMLAMGYASGLEEDRNPLTTTVLVIMVAVVLLLIMDLEQPGRGMIRTSQQPLLELQQKLHTQHARSRSSSRIARATAWPSMTRGAPLRGHVRPYARVHAAQL